MICHSKKFIFCHHGKCAGTSIKNAIRAAEPSLRKELRETISGHMSLAQMEEKIKEAGGNPDEYFKFTVVRNPWDRVVSWWFHWQKIENTKIDFSDFVMQRRMLYRDLDKMDFILKFENLDEDFKKLCNIIDIKHVNLPHVQYGTNRPDKNYRRYYKDNREAKKAILRVHRKTIEKFDYKF